MFRPQAGTCTMQLSQVLCQLQKPYQPSRGITHGQHTLCQDEHHPASHCFTTAGSLRELLPTNATSISPGPPVQGQLQAAIFPPTGTNQVQETTDAASPCYAAIP